MAFGGQIFCRGYRIEKPIDIACKRCFQYPLNLSILLLPYRIQKNAGIIDIRIVISK